MKEQWMVANKKADFKEIIHIVDMDGVFVGHLVNEDAIRSIAEQLPFSQHLDDDLQRIQSFVLRYDGIRYVEQQMQAHKQKAHNALASFHQSDVKSALLQLLQYTIIRTY